MMSRFLLSCLVAVLLTTSCLGLPSSTLCPDTTWGEYDGSCYRYISNRATWEDAKQNCRSLSPGSDLASLHNSEEHTFLYYFMRSQAGNEAGSQFWVWLGVNDIATEGTYVNADGSQCDYMDWSAGEPSGGAEDCVHTRFYLNEWGWNDLPCTHLLPSFCKITTPCGQ